MKTYQIITLLSIRSGVSGEAIAKSIGYANYMKAVEALLAKKLLLNEETVSYDGANVVANLLNTI